MLNSKLKNIVFFWFAKYFILYIFILIKNQDYTLLSVHELKSGGDVFYYLWTFLFIPTVTGLILIAPLYYSFKIENPLLFSMTVIVLLILDYLGYSYFTSQKIIDFYGMVSIVIGIISFVLCFFKNLKIKFAPHLK